MYHLDSREDNEQLYIKSKKKINNYSTRAGGLAWLRYRLDMESSNDVYNTNNAVDKHQMVTRNNIKTPDEDSVGPDKILWNEYKDYLDLKVSKITLPICFGIQKQSDH